MERGVLNQYADCIHSLPAQKHYISPSIKSKKSPAKRRHTENVPKYVLYALIKLAARYDK